MTQARINADAETFCQNTFEQMMDQSKGVYGVLISTVDGHAVTRKFKRELPQERLAAMMSSMLALGESVAREADQAQCRYVIVENSDGYILTLKLKEKLVLSVIANTDANLGMLHSISRSAAEKLARSIK